MKAGATATAAGSHFIGRPMPRLEDRRFIAGRGQYTDDVVVPDELRAAVVRSPYAHARIRAIRTDAARRAPGIVAVLTGADYRADGCGPIAHGPGTNDTVDPTKPAFDPAAGALVVEVPQQVLAAERVFFVGEAVALVIGTTAAAARDAAELVEVDYDPLAAVVGIGDAVADGAPQLRPEAPGNICLDGRFGDEARTAAAFATAHHVVEREFFNQRIVAAYMEPRASIGAYDAQRDSYRLISGSQGTLRDRALVAGALGIPRTKLDVFCPDVGGGFGSRSHVSPEAVLVTWAARRVGRPVRWVADRSEGFLTDFQGRDAVVVAALAFGPGGRIVAMRQFARFNVGAYTVNYSSPTNYSKIAPTVYDVPVASVRIQGVLSNTVPVNSYRGAGRPEATFTMERLLDIAATELGLDRLEIRRRNLIPKTALPYRTATGLTYDSGDFRANMDRALVLADWAGFPDRRAESATRGCLRGIGVANYVESPGGNPRERVAIRVHAEGYVELEIGTQSTGQGHETTFAQVAAEYLGVEVEAIRVLTGDSRSSDVGGGTHSNRSMRLGGMLIVKTCKEIVERARTLGAQRGNGAAPSLFELAAGGGLQAEAEFNGRIPAFPTGAVVCELEVDPATGAVTILRYTQVDDVGQAINPLIVHGQIHGGIAQGIGQALMEAFPLDPQTGQVLGGTFMDYALPHAADLPALDLELVEDPTAGNELRVKGAGEGGLTPAPAAVIGAVVDAVRHLGIDHIEMPATAPRIWEMIEAATALTPTL